MNKKKIFPILIAALLLFGVDLKAQNKTADQEIEQAAAEDELIELPLDNTEATTNLSPENLSPEEQSTTLEDKEGVEIEKSRVKLRKKLCKCDYFTDVPYTERRSRWGGYLGFQWGNFSPTNYRPSFNTTTDFGTFYTQASGSIEIVFGAKLNFFLGSIGPQITAGYYSNANAASSATLTIIPVTGGIRYALDNLFKEPYVVPYVVGGMYTGIYNETQEGLSVKGYSAFAPYYAVGALFQLDWMDRDAHESGYEDFGLENTYLFAEGRSFLPATNNLPDLSTPLQIFAGLQTEF